MPEQPNELPEGGEGGSGPIRFPKGEFPQELPVNPVINQAALLQEVLNVRGRLHQLENAQLIASVTGKSSLAAETIFHPQELPEGGEGGGTGTIHPGEFPAELPVMDRFASLEKQVATLSEAVGKLSQQLGKNVGG